jgi:hypothetical protein
MNFKVGDILICRKTSIPKPHNDSDWVPCIYMFQGVEYIVVGVDDEDYGDRVGAQIRGTC